MSFSTPTPSGYWSRLRDPRPLSDREQEALERAGQRTFATLSQGDRSPLTDLYAHPQKLAFVLAGSFAGVGALVGSVARGGGFLGALVGAMVGYVGGLWVRSSQNNKARVELAHFPEGATVRDLEADPVERSRQAQSDAWTTQLMVLTRP